MGYNHPDILKSNPYYDDFEDTKNFLRILFKPGYAVQARELTQLQTLLQNQIAKFGSHIFKDGSQVFGGGISLGDADYIRCTVGYNTSNITNAEQLVGKILTYGNNSSSLVRAKIVDVFAPTSQDPYTVFVIKYLTGNTFSENTELLLEETNLGYVTIRHPTAASIPSGNSLKGQLQTISVDSGIFYVDGFFVNNTAQTTALYILDNGIRKFNDRILTSEGVNNRVGFEIERTAVTAEIDTTLVDPARGFYNYNAPGADRYKINLNLIAQEFDPSSVEPGEFVTSDFVELARTVYGVLDYVKKVPTYAELVDTLARRTYDESGNYTVKPFELEVKNHYRDDVYSLFVKVNSGASVNFFVGDHILTKFNGDDTKIGKIVSFETYLPTSDEINSTSTADLPTHVIRVTRIKNYQGTLDYPFFTTSSVDNQNIVYYANADFSTSYLLGIVKRVTASRDPDGVYSPEEGGTENKFVLSIKPGKAYVFGYEFETINNTNLVVDKSRADSVIAVDDYNLGANIGNYFIVDTPFNNWYSSIDLESTPNLKFGGRYTRITIPYQQEDKRTAYLKYWSPLVVDQDRNTFRTVAFLTKNEALNTESIAGHTDISSSDYLYLIDTSGDTVSGGSEDEGFIRPQIAQRAETKFIGGGTSKASYSIVNMSNTVESNISRFVFTDPWHGNVQTAYDITSEDDPSQSTYSLQTFPIKQIKCLDTANPSNIQVTTGNALRWIPASTTGSSSTSGSTLYVQVTESISYDGSTEYGAGSAHFNIDDSVVFTDPATTTSPISYGTSIAYVIREANTKRLIVRPNGSAGCNGAADCSDEGQGGFFAVGDIVTQNYIREGIEVQAVGEVLAVGGDFALPTQGNDGVEVYIQSTGVYPFFGVNDEEISTENITELGCIIGPCGVYRPRSSVSLNNPTCGELVRIGFKDSEDVGGYTINAITFQYNFLALQEDINGIPSYNVNDLVKGRVISWNQNSKELIVLETQGRFEKANGTVYQLESGTQAQVKYGGRGWDKFRTKYSKDETPLSGVDLNDIEKVSGIFVDIADQVTNNLVETSVSVFDYAEGRRGENVAQIASPNIDNYTSGKDYVVNEVIKQERGTEGQALGVVLSFTHRDPTNPADESPTVIIIQPANAIAFEVNNPSYPYIQSVTNATKRYDVSGASTTKTKEIIGCGRLRLLKKQDGNLYQAFFFDVKMDYLPDLSRKYNLNEVFQFFYEENFANSLISNFEDEDIQLSSDTDENDYIFEVNSTYGVEDSGTNSVFTYSKIFDADLNTLLFSLPGSTSVKTVGEMDYRIQQQYSSVTTGSSSSVEFTSDDPYVRFIGGESSLTGKVDSNDLLEHYILINNGIIINLSSGDYLVTTNNYSSPTSQSKVTITKTAGTTWSGRLQLICNLNVNPKPNTTDSELQTMVKGGIRIKIPKRFTETVTLKKTKSGTWKANLTYSDVFAIDKITIPSSVEDKKAQYVLYDGQTDNVYDFGQVTLKNEYLINGVPESTEIEVSYRYFYHSGFGPITVDSYLQTVDYSDIPYYTSPSTGRTYKLDSVIDMRPIKSKSGNAVNISKKWIPAPATSFDVDYEYYLSRGYKLVITRDLRFKLISGIAAFEPELPADDENSMTIYDIVAEPYIFNKNDITATMVNNRRYTMKDIIALDERIEALEQFTILNSLEQQVDAKPIFDDSNIQRVKSSILVDNFATHARSDVKNEQYNISIDPEENSIRPPFKMHAIDLDETNVTLNGVVKTTDNVVMLPYSEVPFIVQYSASGVEKINPFNDISWIGTVKLSPSSDSWFDVDETPDVRENESGANDAVELIQPNPSNGNNNGLGMEWNFWKRKWFGKRRKKKNKKSSLKNKRLNRLRNRLAQLGFYPPKGPMITDGSRTPAFDFPPPNQVNVGQNVVVDKSVVPFIREQTISATVEGMKPYTTVYVFFDDVDITSECQILNNVGEIVYTGGLRTDGQGSVQFSFSTGKKKFKSGDKNLVVTDSSSNNSSRASTVAEAIFTASGAIEVSSNTAVSTRKLLKKPSAYSKNISDPLAQTFFVDEKQYPQGVFVSSVDVFFSAKDNTLPVTLELRPTTAGFPATREQTAVYPFSSVTLYPESIVVSSSPNTSIENTKTTFTFSTPVHLLPGEHCMVLRTNSSAYDVYVAELGEMLIDSSARISQSAAVGSFFKSQNAGRWASYETKDIMFGLNKCEFELSTGSNEIVLKDVLQPTKSEQEFQTYTINNDEVKFNNTEITYAVRTVDATGSVLSANKVYVNSNINIGLPVSSKVVYNNESFELTVGLDSSSVDVSPVFDIDRLSVIGIENIVENNTNISPLSPTYNGELNPATPISLGETPRARYITKIVELQKGLESTNVEVTLGVNTTADTKVQVFIKQQSAGKDSLFDDEEYIEMVSTKPDHVSPDENTFEEISYKLPTDLAQPFSKFAIKICLYSGNPVRVPKIKELRVVSVV
jgi:hypothetical protein